MIAVYFQNHLNSLLVGENYHTHERSRSSSTSRRLQYTDHNTSIIIISRSLLSNAYTRLYIPEKPNQRIVNS